MFSNARADLEIHLKAALRLADEAEVGVVHHHVQIGQLVLRADSEFLDHELEIVVARERDDLAFGSAARTPSAAGSVQPSGPA